MVTGIVIPHDITKALQTVEFRNLADYQAAVGGYIETIQLVDHPLLIVANEEGKIRRLPLNERATCIWWLLNPAGLGGDELVGDVVLLGPVKQGEITSAPRRIIALVLETRRFQVQVRLGQERDTWVSIGEPVDDFFEATLRALSLMEVRNPPSDVKVVAAE